MHDKNILLNTRSKRNCHLTLQKWHTMEINQSNRKFGYGKLFQALFPFELLDMSTYLHIINGLWFGKSAIFFIKIPISNTTNASIRIFEFNSHSNSNRVTHSKGRMVHKSQSFIRQIPKVQQLSVKLVCQHNMMRSGGAFYSMFA